MKNTTYYEWVLEPIDKYGDIIDPLFEEKLSSHCNCPHGLPHDDEAVSYDLALVRREGNEYEGETYREYAYIRQDGTLPERFIVENPMSYRVPKRFHAELKRHREAVQKILSAL
jgi:hypothetical protein